LGFTLLIGNDDDYTDEQKVFVSHVFASETMRQKNTRGGYATPYASDMGACVPMGEVVGALPSGRLAAEPLSDGISPTRGSDGQGPTAVLKSVGKVDNAEVS
jgi:formate C-acetyltransferase